MRLTESELADLLARRKCSVLKEVPTVTSGSTTQRLSPKKPRRYRNEPVEVNGQRFDSKHEAAVYAQLQMMEAAGAISELRRQVIFPLAPAVVLDGRVKPQLRYVADFVFLRDGVEVIADAKSAITRKDKSYRIKKHLIMAKYGKEIEEL